MSTFQPFPRLPLELRIRIWTFAFVDDRVLKIRRSIPDRGFWSPTPVPAVTRACQESREYCSYQKSFVIPGLPRYIWANFSRDIVQLLGSLMSDLSETPIPERTTITYLRIELSIAGHDWDDPEWFYHSYSQKFRHFPSLQRCDVLVDDGLYNWGDFIDETYWGTCPKSNVRMIDAKTGEYIDKTTAGPYLDWIDTGRGEVTNYTRIDDCWDEEDEEDVKQRWEAMMGMKKGLPRVELA